MPGTDGDDIISGMPWTVPCKRGERVWMLDKVGNQLDGNATVVRCDVMSAGLTRSAGREEEKGSR